MFGRDCAEMVSWAALILQEGKKYTFSDYFELANPTEDIAEALGYSFETRILQLPTAANAERTNIAAMR